MHILFLTDNFPPEGNAPATRTYEHVIEWVKAGNRVTVITCVPNFPEGKVYPGYKNKWLSREFINGIEVWRVKTFISANEGFVKRSLDFLSFMFSSFIFGIFTKRVDIVIGTSPQFFTVISAWALSKIKRVPFIFELRDIWPASITAVGAMSGGKIITILEKIEIFLYRQADLIVSVTHSFRDDLVQRGIDPNKISVVLNGVDLSKFQPYESQSTELENVYNLKGKFVAGYVGTLGLAHALDNIVKAAERLKYDDDVRIIIAGSGADQRRIEKQVKEYDLKNIVLIPRQPKEKMPELWSLCDISIINLKNTPLFKKVIPSKIFESMSMGIPMVVAIPNGEATEIIKNTATGIVIEPENPNELALAIEKMKKNELHLSYRKSCHEAAKQFDREKLAVRMLNLLQQVMKRN